jgi:hypothetical protein
MDRPGYLPVAAAKTTVHLKKDLSSSCAREKTVEIIQHIHLCPYVDFKSKPLEATPPKGISFLRPVASSWAEN